MPEASHNALIGEQPDNNDDDDSNYVPGPDHEEMLHDDDDNGIPVDENYLPDIIDDIVQDADIVQPNIDEVSLHWEREVPK